jgi:hypothetical protein
MLFLTQGKTNWKYILIVVILAVIVGGGMLGYQYQWTPREEIILPKKEKISEIISLDEIWNTYVNHKLGFSINIPKRVAGLNRCVEPGETETQFLVPIEVFEDYENNTVYLSQEYYYDARRDSEQQKQIGPCEKIVYSLETLRGERKPFLGWAIIIGTAKTDIELDKFIKRNHAPGCFAGDKKSWKQEGVYEVTIKGEDWNKEGIDLGNTTCPWNYAYKLLYEPKKGKVMSVDLGQECSFYNEKSPESESYRCYDEAMIESFRFE